MNSFAPSLSLRVVAPAMDFYKNVFGATELRCFNNDDGSIHVAELLLGDAEFYLHEEMPGPDKEKAPETLKGTTVALAVYVEDPDTLMAKALKAGARELSPVQDHFYGLRQGAVIDPFGHQWVFQKKI